MDKIGYKFRDNKLFELATTHVSYANENNIESNQRLEFLGDSVLSAIVTEYIYKKYPDFNEGKLTKLRSSVVCKDYLCEVARNISLGKFLKVGKSEKYLSVKQPSMLADTFESLLGAIFLDSDMETAKKWCLYVMKINEKETTYDYKSELQIYFQKEYKNLAKIEYKVIKQTGHAHNPTFSVAVMFDNKKISEGCGKSIKKAEQEAAKQAFANLNVNIENIG